MSRRKVMAARGKTGQILHNKDTELLSPTEARRLIDLASAGLRDAIWSTTAGQFRWRCGSGTRHIRAIWRSRQPLG